MIYDSVRITEERTETDESALPPFPVPLALLSLSLSLLSSLLSSPLLAHVALWLSG